MCKDQGYLWINAVSPISMSSWSFLEGTHDRSLLSYPWRNPCVIGFLAQKIGDPFTHVPNRDEPINPSRIKNNIWDDHLCFEKKTHWGTSSKFMYVHMYVTIIDLQTLKIPSFFFGVSGNGVYTHFHPFPATFMEGYAISAAPLLRPAAHRRPRRCRRSLGKRRLCDWKMLEMSHL